MKVSNNHIKIKSSCSRIKCTPPPSSETLQLPTTRVDISSTSRRLITFSVSGVDRRRYYPLFVRLRHRNPLKFALGKFCPWGSQRSLIMSVAPVRAEAPVGGADPQKPSPYPSSLDPELSKEEGGGEIGRKGKGIRSRITNAPPNIDETL